MKKEVSCGMDAIASTSERALNNEIVIPKSEQEALRSSIQGQAANSKNKKKVTSSQKMGENSQNVFSLRGSSNEPISTQYGGQGQESIYKNTIPSKKDTQINSSGVFLNASYPDTGI